ncbi:hypothetical protein TanjilG_01101 [Lupinus angustifolius]|uniref:Uncharacterized protein n=1 Tax=Lupinus angustifolius TaxID=3871 RepID=A0A1J7GI83_LUPAN|nr:hypothetical protein TanjilG_01101 [Lupinus angustifolius]
MSYSKTSKWLKLKEIVLPYMKENSLVLVIFYIPWNMLSSWSLLDSSRKARLH